MLGGLNKRPDRTAEFPSSDDEAFSTNSILTKVKIYTYGIMYFVCFLVQRRKSVFTIASRRLHSTCATLFGSISSDCSYVSFRGTFPCFTMFTLWYSCLATS